MMNKDEYCCFHPREVVVGVCAHCLRDRLLLLLAASSATPAAADLRRRSSRGISLPKQVFALGSSFLQRLDSSRGHHRRPQASSSSSDDDDDDGTTSAASLDDSFISIKFEDNGKATWEDSSKKQQVVAAAEHVMKRGRWRKQVVGRLLQLARWKRSSPDAARKKNKAAARGWIRSLTSRRRPHHADRACYS